MSRPRLVDQPNISRAWAEAFLLVLDTPGHRLTPLTLSFTGLHEDQIAEELTVRSALDAALVDARMQKTQTVASSLFPQALWRRAKGDRNALYAAYKENLPDYIGFEPYKNGKGLYFARFIAYALDHKTGERLANYPPEAIVEDGNQLEFIIKRCTRGARLSALQASVFDPARDHSRAARLGFPCLQHVTIVPSFADGTLMLNAFYATQQLFAKGYGNYLGLADLGRFLASQVGLLLTRVTCLIGVVKMESMPRKGAPLDALLTACRRVLDVAGANGDRA